MCFSAIFLHVMLHHLQLPLRGARLFDGKSWESNRHNVLGILAMWVSWTRIDKEEKKTFNYAIFHAAYVLFNMMFLLCSILGSISSVLVFIGLKKDQREFLVPWILVMALDIFVDVFYFFFIVIFGNLKFEPLTGTIFTLQFFVLCLNVRTLK